MALIANARWTMTRMTVLGSRFVPSNVSCSIRRKSNRSTRVVQASLVQEIKEDNIKCQEAMNNGTFIAYHRGNPLLDVKVNGDNLKYAVRRLHITELLPHFDNSPERVIENCSFLNLTPEMKSQCAIMIPSKPESKASDLESSSGGVFIDIRMAIFGLPEVEQIQISHGSALLYWNNNFKFCSRCGHKLDRNSAGSQKICSGCKHVHYTPLSPVIIALVSNKERDKCLLVRQPNHIRGMYTAIAGYVEIGETFEDAVVREIAEEVGLDVLHQEYIMSQHWPLPVSTLMLGCFATADSDLELTVDRRELQDAKWFAIPEVKNAVENIETNPMLTLQPKGQSIICVPPKGAVAYDLIKLWLQRISLQT